MNACSRMEYVDTEGAVAAAAARFKAVREAVGPGVGVGLDFHGRVDATAVNFCFQETSLGIHYNGEGGMDLLDYVANKKAFDVDAEGYVATLAGRGSASTSARRRLARWRATPGRTAVDAPGRHADDVPAALGARVARRVRASGGRGGRRRFAERRVAGGWQTTRHATHPTTDFSLHDAPHIWAVCAPIVAAVVLPALRAAFFAAGDPARGLEVDDLFYVRYDADAPGAQTELEAHRDASLLSFSVAMSSPGDFVLHAGEAVTAGVRDILVGFVAVTGEAVNVNFLASPLVTASAHQRLDVAIVNGALVATAL
ncbi:mandelate racemase/muconate lactonizing enzyme [Aureococcus anophagefferens]|nr:mandelate racemase/muconate lactonizing enzyme [Aureococcus anophagefferens]